MSDIEELIAEVGQFISSVEQSELIKLFTAEEESVANKSRYERIGVKYKRSDCKYRKLNQNRSEALNES